MKLKNKNKKIYIVPMVEAESIETASVIAGSGGIESGGTDGNGNHSISGAKGNTCLWNDEEELAEDWSDDDDWSYTYQIE